MERDKLVFIIPTFELGGAERQLLSIVDSLKSEKNITVIGQCKGPLVERFVHSGVTIKTVPPWPGISLLFLLCRLSSIAHKRDITVVEAFLPYSIIIGAIAKLLYRKKILLIGNRRSHVFYRRGRFLLSQLDKWATSRCDALVCNSQSVADEVILEDFIDQKAVYVIPNGISVIRQRPETRFMHHPRIFHVSNHHLYKRTLTLLQAIAENEMLSKISIQLYGDGVETPMLKKFAEVHNLRHVIFHGQISDPWREARFGDLYVHTSETEGFSNSILEAMNNGLLPIVTDIPSNREVVGDCGLFFSVGSQGELGNLLESTLQQSESRKLLAVRAHRRVERNYSVDKVVELRRALYRELLSKL